MSEKEIEFEPAIENLGINVIADGSFRWAPQGKPPWKCDPQTWAKLKKLQPKLFRKCVAKNKKTRR